MILVVILCLVFIESVHDCDIFVLSSFSVVFYFPVKLYFWSSFEGNLPCVLLSVSFVLRGCNEIRFLVLLDV